MSAAFRSLLVTWRHRRPNRRFTLYSALGFSLAVHAAVLSLRLVDPQRFERLFRNSPLEVVLVNARSEEAPAEVQAVAQAALAGGGDAASGRATSPLPASTRFETGDAAESAHRRAEPQPVQTSAQLIALVQRELAALPAPDPAETSGDPQANEIAERRRQLLDQLAEIERRLNEDNARPRLHFVGPATREEAYALYYDRLRRRIEDRGTRDFPSLHGRKLYGELTVNMTIDSRGRLREAEVLVPSGTRALDRQALAIVHAASPFGAFGPGMRSRADEIVVTSRFRFTRGDAVEATIGAPAAAR